MDYAANNYDDYTFKRFLGYSAWLHIGLTAVALLSIWLQRSGNSWGGVGGGDTGVRVSLVGSAGIPMPQPTVPTTSDTVDPTKGLAKEEPKKEEPKTDSTPIQKFDKNKPLPPSKQSKVFENKTPPPPNAIRYGWYIESVRRAISQNWIQSSIDPSVRAARQAHSVVAFRIYRNGTINNIRLDTSSGNRSMDDSAQRALLSIDKLPALPADYSGAYVDVTFDFDLGMIK